MRTVWKFPVPKADEFTHQIPQGAKILDVQVQGGEPQMWVMVEDSRPPESRNFCIVGTGHPMIESNDYGYVGTFQLLAGALIFHVFEIL